MSNDKIHRLVERFMQGATTDSEEQELYRAFRSGNVPDDLKHLSDMFVGLDLVRQPIPATPTKASRIVWWHIASAAAAVALLIVGAWMLFGTQTPSETPHSVVAEKEQDQPVQLAKAKAEEQPVQPTKAEEQPAPQAIAKAKPRKAAKRQSAVVEQASEPTTADDAPTLTPEEQYRLEQQRMIASFRHSTDYETMLQDIRQRGDQIMETALAVCGTSHTAGI